MSRVKRRVATGAVTPIKPRRKLVSLSKSLLKINVKQNTLNPTPATIITSIISAKKMSFIFIIKIAMFTWPRNITKLGLILLIMITTRDIKLTRFSPVVVI